MTNDGFYTVEEEFEGSVLESRDEIYEDIL